MAKVTLNTITSGYASVDALNANFDAIEQAFENTLSRDNTSPNQLEADLDMNNNSIINCAGVEVGGVDIIEEMTTTYNNFLALQGCTVSTSSPSGGNDGDIWFTVI